MGWSSPVNDWAVMVQVRTSIIATLDGRELCVESSGDPSGKALLFHNGTPTSRKLFKDMVEEGNARGANLICYDRPGYGGSTPQPGRTVADSVQDVQTITAHLDIDRIAVWGISGGGPHAIASAVLLPDLVCAAATFCSLAPVSASDFDFFNGMTEKKQKERELYFSDPAGYRQHLHRSREEIMTATKDYLAAKLQAMSPEVRVSQAFYEFSYETMRIAVEKGIEGYWEDHQAFFSDWGFDPSNNSVPIQIWHGQKDSDVPFQYSEWLSKTIPNSELHLTLTDGHFSILENHRVEVMEWLLQHF